MGSFGVSLPVVALNNAYPGDLTRLGGNPVITARPIKTSTTDVGAKFGDPLVLIPGASGTGDTYQSVYDYITDGGTFAASKFAGVAKREVKTQVNFSSLANFPPNQIGLYIPGEMAEGIEQGSCAVQLTAGFTPVSQAAVFIRTAANAALPNSPVGSFVSALDTPVTTTMGTTNGSAVIVVASATGIVVGQIVTGAGVPTGSSVLSISGTNITLSANATATAASGVAVSFQACVQLTGVVFRTGVVDANNVAEITLLSRVAA